MNESWVDRAAASASALLSGPLLGVCPKRDPDGRSVGHMRWMAETLASKTLASETKACRWLGYLQCGVVMHDLSSLSDEKLRNLESKHALE